MDINQLKELFIEEATEVIEKLDVDIINFEENPEKTDLLDELYRGVHTLKGSANAFEFSKLGEFVHHFEDALSYCKDIYKNSEKTVSASQIDVFLEAVDIIKEVLQVEIEGSDKLPQNYNTCLEHIKSITNREEEIANQNINTTENNSESVVESVVDSNFFSENRIITKEDIQTLKSQLSEHEFLYCLKLCLNNDIYIRGFDHLLFFKLLSSEGNIIESYWDMSAVPMLENLEEHSSHINSITIYYASKLSIDEVLEFFEYLEEDEYQVICLDTEQNTSPESSQNNPSQQAEKPLAYKNKAKKSKVKKNNLANHSYIKVNILKLE